MQPQTSATPTLTYPRRRFIRGALRFLGRAVFAGLARVTQTGRQHLPKTGPILLVGNHVAVVEAALMALYTPWQVELLGVGDIPIDPTFAPLVHAFGYIPIRRGHMDRQALNTALSVLNQRGAVGIFPEGGIWDTRLKRTHSGVAWLSYHAQAPVLPIGFGGMKGAVAAMVQGKRPHLTMNIGELIPPVQLAPDSESGRKQQFEQAAAQMMARVEQLIPEEDVMRLPVPEEEVFELRVTHGGTLIPLQHGAALSLLCYRPILLDALRRNLKLPPVAALQHLELHPSPQELESAAQAILTYIERDNPYFFTYRLGQQNSTEILAGLHELQQIAQIAQAQGAVLHLQAIRRYRMPGSSEWQMQINAGAPHAM
ncbi:MAG: hypothetical protein OHK0052_16090 [Anaerolineales bacterium]